MEEQLLLVSYGSSGETEDNDGVIDGFTTETVIESMKWGRFHCFMLIIYGMVTMVSACEVMLLAVLFPAVQCEWQISSLQSAMLSMLVFTGMVCGMPLWGVLSDKYGRKPITFLASALSAYIGFLCSFSPNVVWLFLLRFLFGAGITGNNAMTVLISELIGSKYRAITIVTAQAFWATGTVLEVLLAWVVIPTIGWRYLLAISALPTALSLLSWPVVPESLRFLLVSGQKETAMKTLRKAARMNRCRLPPGELQEQVVEERGRMADLFQPEYRRTTLLLIIIWLTSAACYYGNSLVTTELLSMNYCAAPGATASTGASESEKCTCSPLSSSDYGQVAITSVAELIFTPIAIVLPGLIGRRNSMTVCQIFVAVPFFLLLTCVGSSWGVTVLLFIARGFAGSISTVGYLYTLEVYPTQSRGVGLSCCCVAGYFGAILTPLFSQVLLRASVHSALVVYGVMSVTGAVASFLLRIETKGRKMQ